MCAGRRRLGYREGGGAAVPVGPAEPLINAERVDLAELRDRTARATCPPR